MRKTLLFLAGLLAAVALWMLLGESSRRDSPTGEDDGARSERSPVASESARPEEAARSELAPPALGPSQALDERRRTGAPVADHSEERLRVAVVRADNGRPIAQALVCFVDENDILTDEIQQGNLERVFQLGRTFRTDESGGVRVPRPRGGAWIAGSSGSLWGMLALPPGETEARLELAPDPEILVHVVRDDGTPAALVPVSLRRTSGAGSATLSRSLTDSDGFATLTHVSSFLTVEERAPAYSVALELPVEPGLEAPFDPRSWPDTPLEFVLPPTGSVEVRVLQTDGSPLSEPTDVQLQIASASSAEDRAPQQATLHTSSGTALFPFAALGKIFSVSAVPREGGKPGTASGPGPRTKNERVVIEVRAGGAFATLTGRLVNSAGRTLPSTRFEFELFPEGGGSKRTDDAGGFRIGCTEACTDLEILVSDAWDRTLRGGVAVPAPLSPGEHDFGEVRLELGPLLAGGQVLDDADRPLPGARVTCAVDGLDVAACVTDHQGRFLLHGDAEAELLEITAAHARYLPLYEEAPRGSQNLELRLSGVGRIVGRLDLDPQVPLEGIVVRALSDEHGETEARLARYDGSFELAHLSAGRWAVDARVAEELACGAIRVEDVIVRSGETTTDPRLAPLDLRGRFKSFVIRLTDETGAPLALPHARVWRRSPGAEDFDSRAVSLESGELWITTCQPHLDLEITAPGYRNQVLNGVAEDRSVRLDRGARIRLRLVDPPALPAGDRLVLLFQRDTEAGSIFQGRAALDELGEGELQLAEVGRMHVFIELSRLQAGTVPVSQGPETWLEVEDRSDLQEFEIRLSDATRERIVRIVGDG